MHAFKNIIQSCNNIPPKLLYVFDFLGFSTHFLYSPVYPWLPLRKWTAVALILII